MNDDPVLNFHWRLGGPLAADLLDEMVRAAELVLAAVSSMESCPFCERHLLRQEHDYDCRLRPLHDAVERSR